MFSVLTLNLTHFISKNKTKTHKEIYKFVDSQNK